MIFSPVTIRTTLGCQRDLVEHRLGARAAAAAATAGAARYIELGAPLADSERRLNLSSRSPRPSGGHPTRKCIRGARCHRQQRWTFFVRLTTSRVALLWWECRDDRATAAGALQLAIIHPDEGTSHSASHGMGVIVMLIGRQFPAPRLAEPITISDPV